MAPVPDINSAELAPETNDANSSTAPMVVDAENSGEDVIPAVLSFDIEAAKAHLASADSRFGKLMSKVKCRPYEDLDTVEPFR